MKDGHQHPGISMHKLPVGAGFAGLVFTVGSLAIFLIGIPTLWYFLVGAIVLGVVLALILAGLHRSSVGQRDPLNIFDSRFGRH